MDKRVIAEIKSMRRPNGKFEEILSIIFSILLGMDLNAKMLTWEEIQKNMISSKSDIQKLLMEFKW
jgi:hypothetical protein